MKYYQALLLALFLFSIGSCDNKKTKPGIELISVDFSNKKEIDLRDSSKVKILPLEVTDASLLQEIKSIEFLNDKILIYSTDEIVAFDQNGRFIYNINRKGTGPGEYVRIAGFFVKHDSIFLYDDMSKSLLAYDENGNHLSTIKPEEEIALLYPLTNGAFVAKNKYRGANNQTPSVCFLDKNLKKIQDVENRFLTSGNVVADNFYPFDTNNILYWEFLNDTIFSIKNQSEIIPEYFVDFNDYKIPNNIKANNDIEEILNYMNSSDNPKIATCIKYIQEDASFLRFIFVQKEAIINYVMYNKEDKTAHLFRLIDSEKELQPQLFMAYRNGHIIMAALNLNNFEDNPRLLFINEKDI